jgi:hypothetical protein
MRPLCADDLTDDVLIPAMSAASSLQCMVGFFGSAAFRYIAPGKVTFINDTDSILQLLISPALRESDRDAMRDPDHQNDGPNR